jgi:DNA invertase Pin-like site-specific DNA recombinase
MTDFDDTFGEAPSRDTYQGQTFGIYPRVSSLAQSKEDKSSLDAQIEACQEYGEGLGMTLDPACVKKESHTATTLDRPELRALLQLMRERKVRNLVIDRADRLTREGMLPAATLLTQFTKSGILLHVVSMGMVVKNEYQIMMFLQMAFAAQQANKARIHALKRAKHKNARDGRYLRGNRPPYGFLSEMELDANGTPTKVAIVPDLREISGHRAWETRRRICELYLAGNSAGVIATLLTREGVPVSRALAGHENASPYWNPSTILYMLRDPVNVGVARSLRSHYETMPPDEKHDYAWDKKVAHNVKDQIEIPGVVKPPFILTPEEAAEIEQRITNAPHFRPPTRSTASALLRGGLARCGQMTPNGTPCGGALRVTRDGKRHTAYYVCRVHEAQPARCPGLSIRVDLLDLHAWIAILEKLVEPGTLKDLAAAQAALDTSENPTSRLSQLKRTRDSFKSKRDNLFDSLALTSDRDTRATLLAKVEEFGAMIAEAERDLEAYERLSADWEKKAAILKNVRLQMRRYTDKVVSLKVDNPDDAPFIRTIILSLGVRPIVRVENGEYKIVIEYNLGAGTAKPWFQSDELDDGSRLFNETVL